MANQGVKRISASRLMDVVTMRGFVALVRAVGNSSDRMSQVSCPFPQKIQRETQESGRRLRYEVREIEDDFSTCR